jgi:cohesin complex subunit SA-1/2
LTLDNVQDETNPIALAKLLAACFVVRGAQLSIIRRLDSQYVVQIHTTLLTWIGKRLAIYENNKNKKARKTAVVFFRVLLALVTAAESGDALKM